MGLVLVCDGCGQPVEQRQTRRYGLIEPVYYCGFDDEAKANGLPYLMVGSCAQRWENFEAAQRGHRAHLVREFEAWRAGQLAELRTSLQKLPDE